MTHFEKKGEDGIARRHREAALKGKYKPPNAIIKPISTLVEEESDAPKLSEIDYGLQVLDPVAEILKIRQIRYEERFVFIREAFQNVQRSSQEPGHNVSPIVNVTIEEDSLTILDDAGGMGKEKITQLFDVGVSGWGEDIQKSENPFGEGFMSWVILFDKCVVETNDVRAEFDLTEVLKKREEQVLDLSKVYKGQTARSRDHFGRGLFKVTFSNPTENWDASRAYQAALHEGETMAYEALYVNDFSVPLTSFDCDYDEKDVITIKKTDSDGNILVEGCLQPSTLDLCPQFFYFRNIVLTPYYDLPAVTGKVNIRNRRYGQPTQSRDNWQTGTARSGVQLTERLIREELKEYAINTIKYGNDSKIKRQEAFLSRYVPYSQFKYLVRFQVIGHNMLQAIEESIRNKDPDITETEFQKQFTEKMKSQNSLMEAAKETTLDTEESVESYNRRQEHVEQRRTEINKQKMEADEVEVEILNEEEEALEHEEKQIVKDKKNARQQQIQREEEIEHNEEGGRTLADITKMTFWVGVEEIPDYEKLIKDAEYHGYQVAIAYNTLQKEIFTTEGFYADNQNGRFLHIKNFKKTETRTVRLKSVGPKTAEERRIQWVINTFIQSVPEFKDIQFHIATFEIETKLTIPGTKIKEHGRVEKVAAYAQGKDIYMEREIQYGESAAGELDGFYGAKSLKPYLKYNDFPLKNKTIGWGDISLFLEVSLLVAHELAHSVYNTKDNTQEHFEIMGKIMAKFNDVISEHQGRTVLGSASKVPAKFRRALGVEKEDTVAVTYFTGTDLEMEDISKVEKIQKFIERDYVITPEGKAGRILMVKPDGTYEVRSYVSEYDPKTETLSQIEVKEFPLKPGRIYKRNGIYYFIKRIDISSSVVMAFEYENLQDTSYKSAIVINDFSNFEPISRTEQSDFIHTVALSVMQTFGDYFTIPAIVEDMEYILPIDYHSVKYIIEKKYPERFQRVGQNWKGIDRFKFV